MWPSGQAPGTGRPGSGGGGGGGSQQQQRQQATTPEGLLAAYALDRSANAAAFAGAGSSAGGAPGGGGGRGGGPGRPGSAGGSAAAAGPYSFPPGLPPGAPPGYPGGAAAFTLAARQQAAAIERQQELELLALRRIEEEQYVRQVATAELLNQAEAERRVRERATAEMAYEAEIAAQVQHERYAHMAAMRQRAAAAVAAEEEAAAAANLRMRKTMEQQAEHSRNRKHKREAAAAKAKSPAVGKGKGSDGDGGGSTDGADDHVAPASEPPSSASAAAAADTDAKPIQPAGSTPEPNARKRLDAPVTEEEERSEQSQNLDEQLRHFGFAPPNDDGDGDGAAANAGAGTGAAAKKKAVDGGHGKKTPTTKKKKGTPNKAGSKSGSATADGETPTASKSKKKTSTKKKKKKDDGGGAASGAASGTPKSKSKSKSGGKAGGGGGGSSSKAAVGGTPSPKADATTPASSKTGKSKKTPASKKKSPSAAAGGHGGSSGGGGGGALPRGPMPSMDDPVPEITDAEYDNLEALMVQFCRAPLLAEFSQPLSLLHPEMVPVYSKVVKHPVDLGMVCRAVRRRQYRDTRSARIEMWRIFANCVKFHTHPSTREGAIPSFVSIALHLREYFNGLWEEYMLPSDKPAGPVGKAKANANPTEVAYLKSFETREGRRKKRLLSTTTTSLSTRTLEKMADELEKFAQSGGRVDGLDVDPILTDAEAEDDDDYDAVIQALLELKTKLVGIAKDNEEYTVHELETDVKRCYSTEIFEDRPALRKKLTSRLDRLLGKVVVPIYETNCRGVNQSSVWGCMAAAIWARESSKKPFWPALVLGILAPDDQKEDWHKALTDRNEGRLPEKLRQELQAGKRKAEQALRRQSTGKAERMSFFLVEFLGTHEFIWVREADIMENFDPDEDPNEQAAAGNVTKKKRSSRGHGHTPHSEKLRQKAAEEGRWALEEFEMQLNDTCGDLYLSDNDEEEEDGYSYDVLCQSDDENEENVDSGKFDDADHTMTDEEEITELLGTDGLLDYSVAGRRTAKKRAAALKKQKADREKAEQKKKKAEQEKKKKQLAKQVKAEQERKKKSEAAAANKTKAKSKKLERQKELESKREMKELEKRRKKRGRERERIMKDEERRMKKARLISPEKKGSRRLGIPDKKGRAAAIVRGYLTRIAKKEDMKGPGVGGGVMGLPASVVESSGLLGMALAFRAAAGCVEMPGAKSEGSSLRPWEQIDADAPLKSEERCKNLEKQAELLEQAIAKLAKVNERRKDLIKQTELDKEAFEKNIFDAEKRARTTNMLKPKKNKGKSKSEEGMEKAPTHQDEADSGPAEDVKMEEGENSVPLVTSGSQGGEGKGAKEVAESKDDNVPENMDVDKAPVEDLAMKDVSSVAVVAAPVDAEVDPAVEDPAHNSDPEGQFSDANE